LRCQSNHNLNQTKTFPKSFKRKRRKTMEFVEFSIIDSTGAMVLKPLKVEMNFGGSRATWTVRKLVEIFKDSIGRCHCSYVYPSPATGGFFEHLVGDQWYVIHEEGSLVANGKYRFFKSAK
jgi:hypothetical protein